MPPFRTLPQARKPLPDNLGSLLKAILRPGHFYVGPHLSLTWTGPCAEAIAWEIFRGRLLDPAHTRQTRTFLTWNVEPFLSVKMDQESQEIHVVRNVECYVWEAYDAGERTILSRERPKWVRELVGSVPLGQFADASTLGAELIGLLFRAVVGTSRLPLSSLEAPLPGFSFGELFYCYRADASGNEPLGNTHQLVEMLHPDLAAIERAKFVEFLLRACRREELPALARGFAQRWQEIGQSGEGILEAVRRAFNEISLSPYTDFAERLLLFLDSLEQEGQVSEGQIVDLLAHLLRQLGRHLTAYDLVTFHHRGANYPDALLLDVLLTEYLRRIETSPDLFQGTEGRLRRRALRQGWLIRRFYEGHLVPDLPTSPGENQRVLPPSHPRVLEEQILQPGRRTRTLYEQDPLDQHLSPRTREVLQESIRDLEHPRERRELGLALFLYRPLGVGKAATEPDATPLLACEAYSQTLAQQRLRGLPEQPPGNPENPGTLDLVVPGLRAEEVGGIPRLGIVSLLDARQVAGDFVFLQTVSSSIATLLDLFDFTPLWERFPQRLLFESKQVLLVPTPQADRLRLYDGQFRPRLECQVDLSEGYASRAGVEYPRQGLLVVRVWDDEAREHPLNPPIRLLPRE
jgi:hypothetical protein